MGDVSVPRWLRFRNSKTGEEGWQSRPISPWADRYREAPLRWAEAKGMRPCPSTGPHGTRPYQDNAATAHTQATPCAQPGGNRPQTPPGAGTSGLRAGNQMGPTEPSPRGRNKQGAVPNHARPPAGSKAHSESLSESNSRIAVLSMRTPIVVPHRKITCLITECWDFEHYCLSISGDCSGTWRITGGGRDGPGKTVRGVPVMGGSSQM